MQMYEQEAQYQWQNLSPFMSFHCSHSRMILTMCGTQEKIVAIAATG